MSPATQISQERVQRAARAIWRLEDLLDRALLAHGTLTAEVLAAQSEGRLSPGWLHAPVIAKLPALLESLTEARGGALDVHTGMASVGKRLGLEVRADDSPPVRKPEDDVWWPWWPFGSAEEAATARSASEQTARDAGAEVLPLTRRAG